MPTFNQLVRNGRETLEKKYKAPALLKGYNAPKRTMTDHNSPQKRDVYKRQGVPSRMNIGQVLEVHLGRAAKALGWKVCTPVFDGAHESDIQACLKAAGLREDGKTCLLYTSRCV